LTLLIIDIHTHTYPTSDDSSLLPDELIQEAIRIGLDGICITDHDGFWKPQDIAELSKRHGFLVLPGCEVTTEEGHLLVYGLDRYIFGMHRAAFVRDLVDDAGGAIVVRTPTGAPSTSGAATRHIGRWWTGHPATPYSGCPTRWRSETAGARRARTPSPRTSPTGSA
jgi:predicted metal-dependent phosphoesterase TrpH